ncbi:GntR family transcriptional regulator [Rossellomorea aquimaris]|uniref:GntR family transcriptional regulator n=1 Tax=Rossellomorea aquimaris TaxID=189382 RepID=UPI0011E8CE25|nr:GntR family transcriptional regulator [Rossellomorea aquimaris]TYS89374.1 GntR family transcriptional regulator [Rossellomorea aquimaris]
MQRIIKKETLAEQAFNLIKKDIISGKLAPDEELPEKKLAEELGISRTPIREALKRLAAEGLIMISDSKMATVASFTEEDALQFLEIRELLEVYNLEIIADTFQDRLLEELKENLESQWQAIKEDCYEEFIELDREFHLLLAKENPNPKLRDMIHTSNTGVNRAFLVLSNTLRLSAKEAYEEHNRIFTALQSKHVETAKKEMSAHMKNIERRIQGYYQEEEAN